MVAEEARTLMAQLGFRTINEMVGRSDLLELDPTITHWKTKHIDLSRVLAVATKPHPKVGTYCQITQQHGMEYQLDNDLIRESQPAIQDGQPVHLDIEVQNIDRALGTTLSHEVSKKWGAKGLPDKTIHIRCKGSAGQSLGAWLAHGITFEVEGDCNDFVGKGLSGGRIIVYPPKNATFTPEENILVGNVCLYGATAGEAFFRGRAAERFCVRNSGAWTVVEGVGDHGCEYMTGGRAVILGPTGRNFAAGMSGGIAYIWDPKNQLLGNCNLEMVELEPVEEGEDIAELKELIQKHERHTGSTVAARILQHWDDELPRFKKVMPIDYKRALSERQKAAEQEAMQSPAMAGVGGQS
jgi:glutamate synthase (NADPH) large chain